MSVRAVHGYVVLQCQGVKEIRMQFTASTVSCHDCGGYIPIVFIVHSSLLLIISMRLLLVAMYKYTSC